MVKFICPNCQNEDFELKNEMYICKYCLSNFAKEDIDSELFVNIQIANTERNIGNFRKAKSIYENILKNNSIVDLSDVYFGLFLCEEEVIFEKDGKGEMFPSFYRISSNKNSSTSSVFLQNAISCANKYNKKRVEVYKNLAQKIENAKKIYLDIKLKTKPFDIFICFKNTDENGKFTPDRELAMDIYNEFSGKYNIFFSEKTLKDIKSNYREYEPNIYYGLYTASVMLLICSKKEYLESKWIKNEWSRFTKVDIDIEKKKTIIPIFTDGFDVNDLPGELWHYQGIFDDRKFMNTLESTLQNLVRPIDKLEQIKREQENKYKALEDLLIQQRQTAKSVLERKEQKELDLENEVKSTENRIKNAIKKIIDTPYKEGMPKVKDKSKNIENNIIIFGNYPQSTKKPEPIEWQVLDATEDYVKLISDKILDAHIFDKKTNVYLESELKRYLTGKFYNNAFSKEEQNYIVSQNFQDLNNESFDISLLKQKEAKFIKPLIREKTMTKYAKKSGLKSPKDKMFAGKGDYWMVNPLAYKISIDKMAVVNYLGAISEAKIKDKKGIVPIIYVKI